jgi:hypothetical protein
MLSWNHWKNYRIYICFDSSKFVNFWYIQEPLRDWFDHYIMKAVISLYLAFFIYSTWFCEIIPSFLLTVLIILTGVKSSINNFSCFDQDAHFLKDFTSSREWFDQDFFEKFQDFTFIKFHFHLPIFEIVHFSW